MAKEKKRGFFSWLGFGHKDEAQEPTPAEQEQRALEEQEPAQPDASVQPSDATAAPVALPEESAPAAESAAKMAESEAFAEEVVRVSTQQAEEAAAASEPAVTAEAIAPSVEPAPQTVAPEVTADAEPQTEPEAAPVSVAPEAEPVVAETPLEPEAPAPVEEPQAVVEPVAPVSEPPAAQQDAQWDEVQNAIIEDGVVEARETLAEAHSEPAAAPAIEPVTEPQVAPQPELDTAAEPEAEQEVEPEAAPEPEAELAAEPEAAIAGAIVEQEKPTKEGFFARLKRSLLKTKQNLGSGFIGLFRGKKIDDDLFEELEEHLLIADVGVETTRKIIANLTESADRKQLRDAEALYGLLKEEMSGILARVDHPLNVEGKKPFVILMVGVNGVGKTTTIGKLARQFEQQGKSVMLAAGDTFRAAAVEQLQVWGQRNDIPVIAQHTGADSASVIFDAIQAAQARNIDVLIADTAGRLQNKSHLMEELKKIVRVMKKLDVEAPHEVMLTIDASTGQNAISQAKLFHEAVGLTGITLTKLDGTAKGGVIFSVADQFGIPIRYIGVGERIEDLRPFNSGDFIEALFARED